MKTVTVDARKRIRIPDAEPRQVFAYERHADGRMTLTLLKPQTRESFPRGSLKKYVTRRGDLELLTLLKGCSLEAPE